MKRITVSLPDELADRLKEVAGGEGHVSSYVTKALADHMEGESLSEIFAAWEKERPVPAEVRRQAAAELDELGRLPRKTSRRRAG
jgi:predicted transcriptional regulator